MDEVFANRPIKFQLTVGQLRQRLAGMSEQAVIVLLVPKNLSQSGLQSVRAEQ